MRITDQQVLYSYMTDVSILVKMSVSAVWCTHTDHAQPLFGFVSIAAKHFDVTRQLQLLLLQPQTWAVRNKQFWVYHPSLRLWRQQLKLTCYSKMFCSNIEKMKKKGFACKLCLIWTSARTIILDLFLQEPMLLAVQAAVLPLSFKLVIIMNTPQLTDLLDSVGFLHRLSKQTPWLCQKNARKIFAEPIYCHNIYVVWKKSFDYKQYMHIWTKTEKIHAVKRCRWITFLWDCRKHQRHSRNFRCTYHNRTILIQDKSLPW